MLTALYFLALALCILWAIAMSIITGLIVMVIVLWADEVISIGLALLIKNKKWSNILSKIITAILLLLVVGAIYTYRECGSFWSCETFSENTECEK
jgi:hypothetical protein